MYHATNKRKIESKLPPASSSPRTSPFEAASPTLPNRPNKNSPNSPAWLPIFAA